MFQRLFSLGRSRGLRTTLIAVLVIALLSGGIAMAAAPQQITSSAAGTNYFVYTNSSGGTSELDRRDHSLVSDGTVAYCVEAAQDSPHEYDGFNDGTEIDTYYNNTRISKGLEIIMFYGYPSESAGENGLSDRQARYATQVAISCWLAENGISQGSNFYNLTSSNNLRSNGTAEGNACWNYMMELVNSARGQALPTHAATLTPLGSTTISGGYFVRQFSVSLTNCNRGYTMNTSSLPAGSIVDGYTGSNGDTLTARIPVAGNAGGSFSFTVTGQDTRVMANIVVQEATSGSIQSVMYTLSTAQPGAMSRGTLDATLLGQISLTKVDSVTGGAAQGGGSFANVQFQVTGDNGYSSTITTDASGIATTAADLPVPGTYTVTEIAAPNGYLTANPQQVVFLSTDSPDGNGIIQKTVNVSETPMTGQIVITKTDSETGSVPQGEGTFEGAQFHVTGPNGYDQIITTDTSGVASTGTDLPFGTYTATETVAPTGYNLNSTPITLAITANSPVVNGYLQETGIISDTPIKGRVAITKVAYNSVSGEAIPEIGAEFEVYSTAYDSYSNTPDSLRDTITTRAYGIGTSKFLPYGTYRIVQIAGMDGYSFVPSWTVTISENDQTYSYDRVNAVITSLLRIVKVDADTDQQIPLAGTEFQIYHADTDEMVTQVVNYPSETVLSSFVTDETGSVTLPQALAYGRYYAVEINAPHGYLLDNQRVYFDVTGKDTVVEITQSDYPAKGTITIEKTGMAFMSVSQSDYTYDGKTVPVYKPVFGEKGLEGATFTITAAENIYTADGTLRTAEGTVVSTLTTDVSGAATTEELYLGKYIVQETEAPEGYVLDTAKHEVVLTYKGQNTAIVNETVSLENVWQKTYANIYKEAEIYVYDQDGNKNVAGTVRVNPGEGYLFGLYAAEDMYMDNGTSISLSRNADIPKDSLVCTGLTDKNGELTFDSYVPHGKYYVKELSTDNKFLLNDTKYPLDFSYQGQDTASIKLTANPDAGVILNKLDQKDIKLKKTDLTGTVPLSGATIEVYDASGKLVFRNATNAEGEIAFKVTPGTYTFKETIAPDGYSINTAIFTFTVAKDGSVTGNTTVTDAPLPKTGLEAIGIPILPAIAIVAGTLLLGGTVTTVLILRKKKRTNE